MPYSKLKTGGTNLKYRKSAKTIVRQTVGFFVIFLIHSVSGSYKYYVHNLKLSTFHQYASNNTWLEVLNMSLFWIRVPSFSSRILLDLHCEYLCQGNLKILNLLQVNTINISFHHTRDTF